MPMTAEQELDDVRQLIRDRASELGLTLNETSRRIGRNSSYLHQFLYRHSPRVLPEDVRRDLARLLELPESHLNQHPAPSTIAPELPEPMVQRYRPMAFSGPRDLPVYRAQSVREAEALQAFEATGELIARPVNLIGARGAFAVRVASDDFAPIWRRGDLAHFHPNDPPAPGDGVCVTLNGGRRVIGFLCDRPSPGAGAARRLRVADAHGNNARAFELTDVVSIAREVGVLRR